MEKARDGRTAWALAFLLHMALAVALLLVRGTWAPVAPISEGSPRVSVRLVPPPEGLYGSMMAATALPGVANDTQDEQVQAGGGPVPDETLPPPRIDDADSPVPPPPPPPELTQLDEQTLRELEREREELLASLEREKDLAASIADRVVEQMTNHPAPRPAAGPAAGVVQLGTVRELDLDGFAEPVVQEIMERYKLRVAEKEVAGGTTQNFLSSASTSDGGRFTADRRAAPGIYHVFLLSPKAVETMSRLEEAEIRRRGWDPMRTRVKRVKFGIVGRPPEMDLGIVHFDAEPLQ